MVHLPNSGEGLDWAARRAHHGPREAEQDNDQHQVGLEDGAPGKAMAESLAGSRLRQTGPRVGRT